MRYYEIIILVNDNFQYKIDETLKYYKNKILDSKDSKIYKIEKVGSRKLAYCIKKLNTAFYIILNIKCKISFIEKLEIDIKRNEIIIRHLIINIKYPTTNKSKLSLIK